jgi:hypothetical protein
MLLLFSSGFGPAPAVTYGPAALSMNQSFLELQNQVLRNLDEVEDDGTTRDLVKDTLNQMHQQRCTEFLWPFMLWNRTETITTVAGQRTYTLHQEFERPLFVRNNTKQCLLREVPNANIQEGALTDDATGTAYSFSLWGISPVPTQPSAATGLRIRSSDSADNTASHTVRIRGVLSDGDVVTETLTANGTSNVSSSETTYVEILNVTKTTPWTGAMILETSGGTQLLLLRSNETSRYYRQLHLLDIPTNAETIKYRFYRKPLVMVNDSDVPDLPSPHGRILVWDTLVHMASYNKIGNAERINIWREQREKAEEALYTTYRDAQTLLALPRTHREIAPHLDYVDY